MMTQLNPNWFATKYFCIWYDIAKWVKKKHPAEKSRIESQKLNNCFMKGLQHMPKLVSLKYI